VTAGTGVVPTPHGDAAVTLDVPAGPPRALLVLGHGAGGTVESPDLAAVAAAAVGAGYAVVRVTQPYRVAGRKAPPRAPVLDEAWLTVLAALPVPGLPLVVGGRSSGARVACRTATAAGAAAVVTLAFPTAPPRTPEKDRLAELAAPTVPVLVVQGAADPFGVPPPAPGRTVTVLPGATHTIRGAAAHAAATAVLTWLDTVVPPEPAADGAPTADPSAAGEANAGRAAAGQGDARPTAEAVPPPAAGGAAVTYVVARVRPAAPA
jgi:predicted alpha/beta-hydrolase family hydrolase